jgi:hypothetical protein
MALSTATAPAGCVAVSSRIVAFGKSPIVALGQRPIFLLCHGFNSLHGPRKRGISNESAVSPGRHPIR